jgi:hypothetical protein
VSSSLLEIVDALRAYAESQPVIGGASGWEPRGLQQRLFEDRRAHVRVRPVQLDRPMLARLKPGPLLTLIDVSAGGALIQTPARLTPGAHVLIEFLAPGTRRGTVLRSRVMRSQVTGLDGCVRYRGACSFDDVLELGEFLTPAGVNVDEGGRAAMNFELYGPPLALAPPPASPEAGLSELFDEVNRMRTARASRGTIIGYVDAWLRNRVPLLGVRVNAAAANTLRAGDVLSFRMPPVQGDGRGGLCIEFRPACALDESQRRLLEAGACVMSALYTQSL